MISEKKLETIKNCAKVLFVLYLIILFLVIVLKFPTRMIDGVVRQWLSGGEIVRLEPQFIPFKTIIEYIRQAKAITDWFVKNLACNIIMFMPYGVLYSMIAKNRKSLFRRTSVTACLLSVGIEIFQYISGFGCCDIDDVILNTLGAMIGFGIYALIVKVAKKVQINLCR